MNVDLDLKPLEARAGALVEAARRAGADAADTVVAKGVSLSVSARDGKVEESERSEADDFSLRVFVGKRSATVSANILDDTSALAERAVAMARVAPEDDFAGLADQSLLAAAFPDLDLIDPIQPDAAALTDTALAAEAAGLAVDGVSKSGGAHASTSLSGLVLATSHGFSGSYLVSRHSLSMTAIAGSGTEMERDYEASVATYREDLDAAEDIGKRAGERTVRRLSPEKLSTRQATVVYEPRVAASLVRHFTSAINGASVARKTSFLQNRLGERVFAPGIRIIDDPKRRRGMRSHPFDGEGVVAEAIVLAEDGVLKTWLLDSASARELDLVTNGRAGRSGGATTPASTNVTLAAGDKSPAALMAEIGSGLFVTDLIGQGVNGVTGDYSRGAAGFWFENGEITTPVSEITIASNLKEMFARLTPADDLEYRFGIEVPTVAVEGVTIAGR